MTISAQMAARRDPRHRCHFKLFWVRATLKEQAPGAPYLVVQQTLTHYQCVCGCVYTAQAHRPPKSTEEVV